jgi:predicted nucleotide-binding protein (sugar kinase/HSP70/actin superfamily)
MIEVVEPEEEEYVCYNLNIKDLYVYYFRINTLQIIFTPRMSLPLHTQSSLQ